ncbi:uncharacterized protein LOC135340238 isoform X2 [Halichondria panicea]|uniref:uncharacterized protein LOC135340238 isoform X2 n=1 Tax=Halichondria panicea TaxID=6063 RepID=UPI00312B7C4F
MSTKQGLKWEPWLAEHFQDLVEDNPLNVGYLDSIDKVDEQFQGTATHGLARSSTSFTFEDMKKIISKMPPKQLVKTDKDGDLPVHSAILSGTKVDKKKIGLFVQGDPQQIKKILRAKNNKGKTPIELAFETQHSTAVELLFNLCVQHDVLSHLTGINFNMLDRSNTLLHIASKWSWFLDIVIDACKQFHHDIIPAIQVLDEKDYTPFYYLMNCIPNDPNKLSTFRAVLDLLKQNEVDINTIYTDSNERTMLHEAQRRNNTHAVSLLVEWYNHKDVPDKQGVKPSQRNHHIPLLSEEVEQSFAPSQITGDQSLPVYQQPPPERTPLTQDEIDALQKLIEGTEVNIDDIIATGQGITLEEAQQLFSQKGYIEDARNLRTKLKEIVQQRYLEILKDLMTAADTIDLRYLKLFLVGPPFVGKTTTLSRLLKVFENIYSAGDKAKLQSTLLANCIQAFAIVGDDSAEWQSSNDFDSDLDSEAKIVLNYFCGHKQIAKEAPLDIPLSEEHTTPPKPARTQPHVQQDKPHTQNSQVEAYIKDQRISDIVSRFQKLIKSGEYSNLFNALGTFLNINDIGGQPGFLEMLPALSTGPAMYLVFLDLSKELNKPYKIAFSRDKTIITPYDSIHTVKDTVSQILSSISSIHSNPQVTSSFKTDTVAGFREKLECFLQVSPLAALIGTHKDKLENPEEVIEEDLKDIVQKFDKVMICPSANSSSKVLFTVDNYTGTEQSDIAPLRKLLSEIFHKRFKDALLPIRPKWLLFGLILRREYKIASIEDCLELGKKLEMDENETKFCLRYLHDCVGTVMHYTNITNDKEKWLKNRVICSPQVVFDSISQLILPSMRELHSGGTFTEYERKELIRKGQYSAEAIEMYCKTAQVSKKLGNNELIPAKALITLLQHLNLLSEIIHIDVNNKSKYRSTYLMPAILECVSLTNPPPPDANNPEPLLITFSCGYVPTGAFCGLITQLVSRGTHGILGLTWKLVEDGVKRNCVSFVIDAVHTVTIISRERYYEIRVCLKKSKISVNEVCAYVWSVIQYILSGLYERLVPQIAFQCHCPKHSEEPNLNDICSISLGSEVRFLCERSKDPVTLRKTQMVWLGKAISIGQSASLGVFGFVKEQSLKRFSFNWSKVGDDNTQPIHPCKPNILTFQSVSEEDLDYYQCEVKEAGTVVLTVYRTFYKDELIPQTLGTSDSATQRGLPANQVTLQELIKRYSLTDEQLNSKIEYSDTPKLALCFDNVELYSSSMKLPLAEQADVNMLYYREGTQTAMMKCLKIWKQHNPYQATYRALLDIVLGLYKGETAHQICQQLTPRGVRGVVTGSDS